MGGGGVGVRRGGGEDENYDRRVNAYGPPTLLIFHCNFRDATVINVGA